MRAVMVDHLEAVALIGTQRTILRHREISRYRRDQQS
jgi:hypothetical protein